MSRISLTGLLLLVSLLTGCANIPSPAALPQYSAPNAPNAPNARNAPNAPEAASGYTEKIGVAAKHFMVASANPLATRAGVDMLKAGGSAVDAAIATQMVLTLVEPQSSGIGGGGFMMVADHGTVTSFDGRETAPANATERLFQDANGKPLAFYDGVIGGRSVGVPGQLRMLELAHKRFGKLPWHTLFAPAIGLAESGFRVSPRLARLLQIDAYLKRDPSAAAYFYDAEGQPRKQGQLLNNPALAQALREVATGGAQAFYIGRIARDIVRKVQGHPTNPGALTQADLAMYQAKERVPICSDYKLWKVCGVPPPSSGGIAIGQLLGILAYQDIAAHPPENAELDPVAVHLFSEAGRLVFADRARYVADTDFVPLPGGDSKALLDPRYLALRSALIGPGSMGVAQPGQPAGAQLSTGSDSSPEYHSTSHMSIVDPSGQVIAMTSSIEDQFGARQMVDGFLLNNQLTDFSFTAVDASGSVANRVQGGKRPRSAMSPTLVFDKQSDQPVLAIGSAGGPAIINHVAKVLVGMADWGLNVQEAISLPNFGSHNGPTELEQGRVSQALVGALRARGHDLVISEQTSGMQGIMRMKIHGEDFWFGGVDPRREGLAQGE